MMQPSADLVLHGPGTQRNSGEMKPEIRYIRFRSRFDFEVGELIKSPCKECLRREEFPHCQKDCRLIDRVQEILAETVSSQRRT